MTRTTRSSVQIDAGLNGKELPAARPVPPRRASRRLSSGRKTDEAQPSSAVDDTIHAAPEGLTPEGRDPDPDLFSNEPSNPPPPASGGRTTRSKAGNAKQEGQHDGASASTRASSRGGGCPGEAERNSDQQGMSAGDTGKLQTSVPGTEDEGSELEASGAHDQILHLPKRSGPARASAASSGVGWAMVDESEGPPVKKTVFEVIENSTITTKEGQRRSGRNATKVSKMNGKSAPSRRPSKEPKDVKQEEGVAGSSRPADWSADEEPPRAPGKADIDAGSSLPSLNNQAEHDRPDEGKMDDSDSELSSLPDPSASEAESVVSDPDDDSASEAEAGSDTDDKAQNARRKIVLKRKEHTADKMDHEGDQAKSRHERSQEKGHRRISLKRPKPKAVVPESADDQSSSSGSSSDEDAHDSTGLFSGDSDDPKGSEEDDYEDDFPHHSKSRRKSLPSGSSKDPGGKSKAEHKHSDKTRGEGKSDKSKHDDPVAEKRKKLDRLLQKRKRDTHESEHATSEVQERERSNKVQRLERKGETKEERRARHAEKLKRRSKASSDQSQPKGKAEKASPHPSASARVDTSFFGGSNKSSTSVVSSPAAAGATQQKKPSVNKPKEQLSAKAAEAAGAARIKAAQEAAAAQRIAQAKAAATGPRTSINRPRPGAELLAGLYGTKPSTGSPSVKPGTPKSVGKGSGQNSGATTPLWRSSLLQKREHGASSKADHEREAEMRRLRVEEREKRRKARGFDLLRLPDAVGESGRLVHQHVKLDKRLPTAHWTFGIAPSLWTRQGPMDPPGENFVYRHPQHVDFRLRREPDKTRPAEAAAQPAEATT